MSKSMTSEDALKDHFNDQFSTTGGDESEPMQFMSYSCGGTPVQD